MTTPENSIAIVGIACRYPDAHSPEELWQNVLGQRRAFRRIPAERLRLADYLSGTGSPESIELEQAALIEGWELDRVRFKVGARAYRTADLAHWLALDVASDALADAGFAEGDGLERDTTGVLLGNTLTGEFSRANQLRLRWPYARRQMSAALAAEGWDDGRREAFLERLEESYKAPFPETNEESLAGGLANTIAGRICNHFDLHGGGYTVDGACASSLLAVTQAATALTVGDLDVALAGGVDLSLDPFELVGFARVGALARGDMRIYDEGSSGFLPGEGCGMVVLMHLRDALAQGRRIYATIRGWGVSSDGSGGLTRPEASGQLLALGRAYRRAGFGIDSVDLVEGHGTGTPVGDAVELEVLERARSGARERAALGSIKANVGHTKAAAGIAGLIKASLALDRQLLPPTTGCVTPHPMLRRPESSLRVLDHPEAWPAGRPRRAAVSAMGFGGINTHLALEGIGPRRAAARSVTVERLRRTPQDAEIFFLQAADRDSLAADVERLETRAPRLSRAELTDLAADFARRPEPASPGAPRAAIVAATPTELARGLSTLGAWLSEGTDVRLDADAGVFLGRAGRRPRVGFLFPGQGSPARLGGGLWRRRFAAVEELYPETPAPDAVGNAIDTALAQPAIVTASLAALEVLASLGVEADVALGHSLGELAALYWAGAYDAAALRDLAGERGRAMSELGESGGAMASLGAAAPEVEELVEEIRIEAKGHALAVTGFNSPRQTVVSGTTAAVEAAVERARERGWRATRLAVSHAFHSPLMAAAAPRLRAALERQPSTALERQVASTVTGDWLEPEADWRRLLERQLTSPVRFTEALERAAAEVDLFLEVGPGAVLAGLARDTVATPAIALDAGGKSLRGLLRAAGALFAAGAPLDTEALFVDRFARPFDLEREPRFLANPCEEAPVDAVPLRTARRPAVPAQTPTVAAASAVITPTIDAEADGDGDGDDNALSVVRRLLARRAELPLETIAGDSRLLSDLHLSSIAVAELVTAAARALGLPSPVAPTEYADATVSEMARALEELRSTGGDVSASDVEALPAGLDAWVRPFTVTWVERPLPWPARIVAGSRTESGWKVFAPAGSPWRPALERALAGTPDGGVALYLSEKSDLDLLLAAARAALAERASRFLLVDHGSGAAAFARTLHLESPRTDVAVVELPADFEPEKGAALAAAEAAAASDYAEARYDLHGRRQSPVLRPLAAAGEPTAPALEPGDVLLVTGGGKGIGAECALALGRRYGARLAILGRSEPVADAELEANLERFSAHGVEHRYLRCDLGDAAQVDAAVERARAELGPVRALLHSAGVNHPRLIASLERVDLERTLGAKVAGLDHLLAALDPGELRLLLGFGSLIARTGLRGEAHYALANELLRRRIEGFAEDHPDCRALCLEWSVWSGVGMGARLSRLDALEREGIAPISPEDGVALLEELVARPETPAAVVLSGRFGDTPTLEAEGGELPLLRFLERPRVHVPGIELVADVALGTATDPYLAEHTFDGERLFPAVMGLEAMAQAYVALTGDERPPAFFDVRFSRPITAPEGETVTLRLAALAGTDGVEVALRSDRSGFAVDHFRARLGPASEEEDEPLAPAAPPVNGDRIACEPSTELYGGILFQAGRFRRLRGYRSLRATTCLAEISGGDGTSWFGPYLPGDLLLGDPGARDASIHGIQACIPHATVLPAGVERLTIAGAEPGPRQVLARERSRHGKTLVYDLDVTDESGRVVERWRGLELRVVGEPRQAPRLALPLLGPYVERRLHDLLPGAPLAVAVERNGHDQPERRHQSDRALRRALGREVRVLRRPDGKPEVPGTGGVSISHGGDLVLAVAGPGPVGCDLEPVAERPAEVWRDLLGSDLEPLSELVARELGEDRNAVATRLWAVTESLRKAGRRNGSPLVFESATADGWALFSSGRQRAATVLLEPAGRDQRFVLAVLAES